MSDVRRPDNRKRDLLARRDLFRQVEAFVQQHGRVQLGREVPAAWRHRRNRTPGGCYAAAGRWAGTDGAVYTEGMAFTDDVPVDHAWLTDRDGEVIDLAWQDPGERYLGVQIPDREVKRLMCALAGKPRGALLPLLLTEGWTPDPK